MTTPPPPFTSQTILQKNADINTRSAETFNSLGEVIRDIEASLLNMKVFVPVEIEYHAGDFLGIVNRRVEIGQELGDDDFSSSINGKHKVRAIFVGGKYVAIENSTPVEEKDHDGK